MMPEPIRRLPRPEASRLRSSLVVTSVSRILAELIQNSLDAGASRIDCWVTWSPGEIALWVEDDGSGMSAEDMERLGERYTSSKNSDHWAGNRGYGFRGEALASIAAISLLKITARQGDFTTTKVVKNGQVLVLGPAREDLPRPHGTTIVVKEVYNSIPVRQAALQSGNPVLECRRMMESYALVAPRVRWTMWGSKPGTMQPTLILAIHDARESIDVFRNVYGYAGVEKVKNVHVSAGDRRVDGFISLEGGFSKAHQHLYVNGYPLNYSELNLCIAQCFAKSQFSAMVSDNIEDIARTKKRPSPRRLERHPIYVLNITLPPEEVDATYEPSKGTLGYKEPSLLRTFLTAVIEDFLRRQGFAPGKGQDRARSVSLSPARRLRLTSRLPEQRSPDSEVHLSRNPHRATTEEGTEHMDDDPEAPPSEPAKLLTPTAQPLPEIHPGSESQNADWVYDLIQNCQSGGVFSIRPEGHEEVEATSDDPTRLTKLPVSLSDVEFPATSLESPTILRQVDRKFVPCVLQGTVGSTSHKVLVVFDQHAADERAAVETILGSLCDGFVNGDLPLTQLEEGQLRIVLTRSEVEVLERSGTRDILKRWGIELAPVETPEGEYIQVGVLAVPALLERLASKKGVELTRLLRLYLPIVDQDLGGIQATISVPEDQEGRARIQRWMPQEMAELANSKACRGAIMFEDKLNHDQCTRLISRLAATRNPWVCAHGRPTFVPLCILPHRHTPKRKIDWTRWAQEHT